MATVEEAVVGADAVVITTGAPEFHGLSPNGLAAVMGGNVVVDAAGVCDLDEWAGADLVVYGVGRGVPVVFHPVVWTPLQWTEGSRVPAAL